MDPDCELRTAALHAALHLGSGSAGSEVRLWKLHPAGRRGDLPLASGKSLMQLAWDEVEALGARQGQRIVRTSEIKPFAASVAKLELERQARLASCVGEATPPWRALAAMTKPELKLVFVQLGAKLVGLARFDRLIRLGTGALADLDGDCVREIGRAMRDTDSAPTMRLDAATAASLETALEVAGHERRGTDALYVLGRRIVAACYANVGPAIREGFARTARTSLATILVEEATAIRMTEPDLVGVCELLCRQLVSGSSKS